MTAAGRFDRVYQVSPQSDPFLSFYLGKLQPYYSLNVHLVKILGTLKKASAAAFQGTGSDPL
jgi:hypothetical protein